MMNADLSRLVRQMAFAAVLLFAAKETARAQALNANEKLELEKTLLTYPDNPLDPAWQKAWAKHLGVAISPRARNDFGPNNFYAIVFKNQTPCTIKLNAEYLGKLTKDGNTKAKEVAPWTILPGKSLYVGVRPKLPTVSIKNDLAGKSIFSLNTFPKPMCQIEVVPDKSDLKPLTLNMIVKYGSDQFERVVAGERFLYRPEDEEQVTTKLGVAPKDRDKKK